MPDVTMSNEANEEEHLTQLFYEFAQMDFSLLRNVYLTLNDFDLSSDEARRRVLLFLHDASTHFEWGWAAPPTTQSTAVSPGHGTWMPDGHVPTTRPFSGTGRRLGDDVLCCRGYSGCTGGPDHVHCGGCGHWPGCNCCSACGATPHEQPA